MDSLSLKYNTYSMNEVNGSGKLNTSQSALANRPLSFDSSKDLTTTTFCNPNDKSCKVNAFADTNNPGMLPVNTKYNNEESKMLPVTIKKDEDSNNYVILENPTMDYNSNDKMITNIPIPEDEKKKQGKKLDSDYKMNLTTQIYVGSLTVVGLFIFYRLLQKTR